MKNLWMTALLAIVVSAGTLAARPAQASVSGRRNTALGLGAAAIYELTQGNTVAGIALGAGAAYSYKRSQDEQRWEDRYDNYRYRHDYRPLRYESSRRWDDRYHDGRYTYDRHSYWHDRR
jgi:hypothetical protein